MRKQILFRVPEETYEAAVILAKEIGISFNGLLNQALRVYLQQEALTDCLEKNRTMPIVRQK